MLIPARPQSRGFEQIGTTKLPRTGHANLGTAASRPVVIGTGDDTARDTAGTDRSTTSRFWIDCTTLRAVITPISAGTMAPHAFPCTTVAALSAVPTSVASVSVAYRLIVFSS